MPRYYCDYCDTYLTHDSPSVRKQHNSGYKHKANVREYYQTFEQQQTQILIDQKIKEHLGQAAVYQQIGPVYNQHLAAYPGIAPRPRPPILPPPVMPIPGVRPPVSVPIAPGYGVLPTVAPIVAPNSSLPMPPSALPNPPAVNVPTVAVGGVETTSINASTSVYSQPMYHINPPGSVALSGVAQLASTTSGGYAYAPAPQAGR